MVMHLTCGGHARRQHAGVVDRIVPGWSSVAEGILEELNGLLVFEDVA